MFLIITALFIFFFVVGYAVGHTAPVKCDGMFICEEDEFGKTYWKLDVNFNPHDLKNKKYVLFKVYPIKREIKDDSASKS